MIDSITVRYNLFLVCKSPIGVPFLTRLIDLDMLGTSASYRRLGIANMLVGWGVTLADQDKLECFVDASDEGKPVYEKFGFVGQEPFLIPGETFTCTSYIRPAKS